MAEQIIPNLNLEYTFIYGLIDPLTNHIRYIGKSDKPYKRLILHCIPARLKGDNHKQNWIKNLLNRNLKPEIIILDKVPKNNWQFWEKHYIELFRNYENSWGYNLTNGSIGGDGRVGYKHTNETKKIMSIKAKNRNSVCSFKGKKHSSESKTKMNKAKKGKSFHTQEWKTFMSNKLKGRTVSEKCILSLKQRNIERGNKNIENIDKQKDLIIKSINNGYSIKDLSVLIGKPIRRYLQIKGLFELAKSNGLNKRKK